MPIVIVGSGPVGLYTAIYLARKGFPVQVIDKYADHFSRPGVVAVEAGQLITRQLAHLGIKVEIPFADSFPETYYISDIQKVLREEAEKLEVKFTSAHFKGIQGDSVEVEGDISPIKCDLLIDCSGESRTVVNYVNSTTSKEIFKVSPIADNPVKTNFIAFITMNQEDAELLSGYRGSHSAINEVKRFEELRAQGWTQNDMPHWDMRRWSFSGGKPSRFCCYFEMPDELARAPESKQREWLSTMLELKAGKKIDFEIEPGSLKFCPFVVDPHQVENPICQSSPFPFPIAVCGDAMMSAEYRKGTGIANGIVCANGLANATQFTGHAYQINETIFYKTFTEYRSTEMCIGEHKKEVRDLYRARRNNLLDHRIQKTKLETYLEAHAMSPEDENIKKGLLEQISGFKKLADTAYLSKDFEKARLIYLEALKACSSLKEKPSSELLELAKLRNLETRIYSNLERTCRYQNKLPEAQEHLADSMAACQQALELLEEPQNEEMQKLKEGLIALHKSLDERREQYTKASTPSFGTGL
ncbi:FAD-dependent monooxygenase [Legionella sp.]|uniref:FAD-dependent monooxygenase n=1 Tax=Legionella sp. TaxID=459 RepID=UPI00321F7A6A